MAHARVSPAANLQMSPKNAGTKLEEQFDEPVELPDFLRQLFELAEAVNHEGHFCIRLGRTTDTPRGRALHPTPSETRLVRLPVGIPTARLASAAAVALERAKAPASAHCSFRCILTSISNSAHPQSFGFRQTWLPCATQVFSMRACFPDR
jgi:hypothetical protein